MFVYSASDRSPLAKPKTAIALLVFLIAIAPFLSTIAPLFPQMRSRYWTANM